MSMSSDDFELKEISSSTENTRDDIENSEKTSTEEESNEMDEVYIYSAGRLIESKLYKCNKCNCMISETKSYISYEKRLNNYVYYCYKCAQMKLKQRKNCFICNQQIGDHMDNEQIVNFGDKFCHRLCMHCKFCNEINDDQTKYNFIHGSLVCHDCIKILNHSCELDKEVIGQFDPDLLSENFDNHCMRCGQEFINNGFIYMNKQILCFNCGNIIQ